MDEVLILSIEEGEMTTVFTKIISKEIPANIVYEDDLSIAFRDLNPKAPVHILIIPKIEEIDRLSSAKEKHKELLGHLLIKATEIAKSEGLEGYRIVINNGEDAGQSVFHLHVHILGGRKFTWPPG